MSWCIPCLVESADPASEVCVDVVPLLALAHIHTVVLGVDLLYEVLVQFLVYFLEVTLAEGLADLPEDVGEYLLEHLLPVVLVNETGAAQLDLEWLLSE